MMDVIDMIHIMANMDIMNAISIMPIMDIILIIIYDTSNILPHLAVRRPCLLPIFALVGTVEPPLAAGGCAGESVLRTGGTSESTRKSGRYDIEGRRRYSANRPLDCLPAPPGVGERYELPKGSSWSLHLLAGASSGGPPHRHQYQGARCQFCITNRLISEPSLSS